VRSTAKTVVRSNFELNFASKEETRILSQDFPRGGEKPRPTTRRARPLQDDDDDDDDSLLRRRKQQKVFQKYGFVLFVQFIISTVCIVMYAVISGLLV